MFGDGSRLELLTVEPVAVAANADAPSQNAATCPVTGDGW